MKRLCKMMTCSRLCLLAIAVFASSLSVSAQCPNDTSCDATVRTLTAVGTGDRNGVFGRSSSTTDSGVYGENLGNGWGVAGSTAGGFAGVLGQGSRNGVYGRSSSVTDSGVYGENTGGGFGVAGVTTSAFPVAAVWGNNSGAGVAVRGTSFGTGLAGYFEGNVQITGDLNVDGVKNAVVKTASFGKRNLYAVESPENWFEDFGHAKLVDGRAVIRIEPMFGETVNTDSDYHVFITPRGDCKGLYVVSQGPNSFEVRELNRGKTNIAFDYRIVAKRRAYEGVRLAESKNPENSERGGRPSGGPPALSPTAAASWSATTFRPVSLQSNNGPTGQAWKCGGTN